MKHARVEFITVCLLLQPQSSQGEEDGAKPAEEADGAAGPKSPIAAAEEAMRRKALIPKSAIMRLLAELVKSYDNVAPLITQHTFIAGQSELVTEVSGLSCHRLKRLNITCAEP